MRALLRPICYFVGHKNYQIRMAAKRFESHKGKTRLVYDIYERIVCGRCNKLQTVFTKKGKTKHERLYLQGVSFEQACVFVPSLKNKKNNETN